MNIYEYRSYRAYLRERLESLGPKSGMKRKAAEKLGVHTTFVSQVVAGKADLSLDQAERMNVFLKHSADEAEQFLDLVIYERASEPRLRERFLDKIKRKQADHQQIHRRLERTREVGAEDQAKFYSSHLHGLLHVLSSIPKFQNRRQLAQATGAPPAVADEAIQFLIRLGILKASKDVVTPGETHIHLSKDSKFIRQHHTNWRLAAIQQMPFGEPSDLHYSLAFSCSEKDAGQIRESMLEHLQTLTKKIEKSKEEEAYVYCFDFFKWR